MVDLTVAAVPGYFATMGAEYLYLRQRAERVGPSPADYESRDTRTSLTMGTLSLLAPLVLPKLVAPFTPGKGKFGKALLGTAIGAALVTTAADVIARTKDSEKARKVAEIGGVTAVVTGGLAATTFWAARTTPDRFWNRRIVRDVGRGPLAVAAAVVGWDFIYYWNHRLQHEARYMWAIHVVHHSSERYNLSTALRQPVGEVLGTFLPYGALCLFGIRPELIHTARGVNLLYQYWIHTEAIRSLGPAEKVFNTASHHRVHHGSNPQYIDRNHGSILIVWDKLFGTFEPERERVRYGLTKNIRTFRPWRVATHEHRDILRDVSRSRSWRDRLSFVVRNPGWAYRRHEELGIDATAEEATPLPA